MSALEDAPINEAPDALETSGLRKADGAREVFVLHDVEGYRHEEVAGLLDVTPGTSKSQLHRARKLLREALSR